MANFSNLITTARGHALVSAILAGEIATEPQTPFTRIVTSSAIYQLSELEGLSDLSEIQQEPLVSAVVRQNETTVQIHGGMNNSELTVGYRLNSVGVYFTDPADRQEYLFGVAVHIPTAEQPNADFIAPFNGSTTTGLIFDLIASVGNADNMSLEVNPAATVTIIQLQNAINEHNRDLDAHQGLLEPHNQDPMAHGPAINNHNTSSTAHQDMRLALTNLSSKVESLAGFNISGIVDTHADLMLVDPIPPDGTMYLVKSDETNSGIMAVYQVVGGVWEFLGEFAINLDDFVTLDQLNAAIAAIDLSNLDVPVSSRASANDLLGLTTNIGTTGSAASPTGNVMARLSELINNRVGAVNATGGSQTAGGANAKLNEALRLLNLGISVNIRVQRGTIQPAPPSVGVESVSANITPVNLARSFVVATHNTQITASQSISVRLTSNQVIYEILHSNNRPSTADTTNNSHLCINWQVVEFL